MVSTDNLSAHPGRTDGNRCHTCRTNCDKWGLDYGEYHCHNPKNTYVAPQPTSKSITDYSSTTRNNSVGSNSSSENNDYDYLIILVGVPLIIIILIGRRHPVKTETSNQLNYSDQTYNGNRCPYCVNHIKPEDRYCSKCGRKVKK